VAEAVENPHRHHFRLAYGVLALAFWLSIAGFIVLLTRHHEAQATRWSHWKPQAQGLLGAHQIALQVAGKYRAADGTQLVAVQEHLPFYAGARIESVGVRRLGENGQLSPYIGLYGTERTLIYSFCGLQSNCSISGENTSIQDQILRREALELSLFAFKYLKNVDQVVSLVQTVKDGGTSAVFLRKRDLQPELDHPLRATLPLVTPPAAGTANKREGAVIDALTMQNTFPAHYEAQPDGDVMLVLDYAAQGGS
jgi:hypothetical protein